MEWSNESLELLKRFVGRDYYPYCPRDLGPAHYKDVRPVYRALLAKKSQFTYKEMKELRVAYGMNSYEQDMLICRLDAMSLLEYTEHLYRIGDIMEKGYCPVTYSDAVVSRITPLLIRKMWGMVDSFQALNRRTDEIHQSVKELYRLMMNEEWEDDL